MTVSNGTETIDAIGFISRIYVENGRAPRFDVTLERAPYESDPTVRDLARNDFSVLPE